MKLVMEIWAYLSLHWYGILMAGSAMLVAAEFIVRLTPTKKDDGFVARLGANYAKLFDLLKIPNVKRKDGTVMVPDGLHPKKKT